MKVVLKNKNNINCNIMSKTKNNKIKKMNMFNNIVINDAIIKKIDNFIIFGKSQRFTTTGKNLFDISIWENNVPEISYANLNQGNVIINNGQIIINTVNYEDNYTMTGMETTGHIIVENQRKYLIPIKPNTSYTISLDMDEEYPENQNSSWFSLANSNYETTKHGLIGSRASTGYCTCTFESGKNDVWLGIRVGIKGTNITKTYRHIQIEEGNQATNFEPYTGGKPSPNPDYPQEIESISGIENLFNKNNANILNLTFNSNVFSTSSNAKIVYIQIKPNTTYTISKMLSSRFRLATTSNIPTNGTNPNIFIEGSSKTVSTITTGNNDNYLSILFYYIVDDTISEQEILDSIMVAEGENDYVPFGKWLIYRNNGKNLFNKNKIDWYRNNLNDFFNNNDTLNNRIRSTSFEINGNSNYIISGFPNNINIVSIRTYDKNENFIRNATLNDSKFYLSDNVKYINLLFSGENFTEETNQLMKNANIQIERGTNITKYEQYQEKILYISPINNIFRSINDVCDELIIDGKTGDYYKLERIGNVILNGSENITTRSNTSTTHSKFRIYNALPNEIINTTGLLTNYFITNGKANSPDGSIDCICSSGNDGYNQQLWISVNNSIATTVSEFKQWLINHNVIVNYILKEPTLTKIGTLTPEQLEKLVLFDGYNNVTFVTGLDSEQEISYYTTEFNDISNYKYKFRKV